MRQNKIDQHVKTIIKCDDVDNISDLHGIKGFKPGKTKKDTNRKIVDGPFNIDGPDNIAVVNHYIVKTRSEHRNKALRGRANTNNVKSLRKVDNFNSENHNEVTDTFASIIYDRSQKEYQSQMQSSLTTLKGGNSASIPIIIYSHSDVFDILKIQLEYFSKLFNNTQHDIYLFSNVPYSDNTSTNVNLKYKTILYDDKDPYFTRLLSCIRQINSEYFIITHESYILLKFDNDIINKLVNEMKENKIDSINLQHKNNYKPEIKITDTLSISKMKSNDLAFCVQPRIWNKESAINLFSSLGNKNYKTSEHNNTQSYIDKNQNTYITHSINYMALPGGVLKTIPEYCYVLITRNGKFMLCKKYDDVNSYVQNEFDNICNRYINNSKRTQTL
jgi:hypothetical protein